MAEATEITAWFAAIYTAANIIALFTSHFTGYQFLVGQGLVLSIYGAHNLFNDKFKDAT